MEKPTHRPDGFSIKDEEGMLVVVLPPVLEADNAVAVYRETKKRLARRPKRLTVKTHQVKEWDGTGLGVLVQLRCDCEKAKIEWQIESDGDPKGFARTLRELKELEPHCQGIARPRPSPLVWLGDQSYRLSSEFFRLTAFVGDLTLALWQTLRHPFRARWGNMLYYMDRTGTEALPITSMITFLMGLILGFQAALQMQKLAGDMYVADLVGLSITRELGPLMVAMICTGRAGSAFAAEIGTMRVNDEVDALTTMGIDRTCFLIVPKVIGLTVVMPLLTLYGDLMGVLGGLLATTLTLEIGVQSYISRTLEVLTFWDVGQGMIKSVVFALLIAGVGCLRGLQAERSAEDVGRSTTSAVVSGVFLIVLFDAALTIVFSRFGV